MNSVKIPGLPKELMEVLQKSAYSDGIQRIAIVGGAVRDLLINKANHRVNLLPKDIDIVVEGSAKDLAELIQKELGKQKKVEIVIHHPYKTAEIKIDTLTIDLATARLETYKNPGENPDVIPSELEKDLARRDFTINAIAIDLINGELIDPQNGREGLEKRQIEFIHDKSVEEDPTRIIRAARYAARLDFDLSESASKQIQSTLASWPWKWIQGSPSDLAPPALSTRLSQEMQLLLEEETWEAGLDKLKKWGALILISSSLQKDDGYSQRVRKSKRLGINQLTAIIAGTNNQFEVAKRLNLPLKQQISIKESSSIINFLLDLTQSQEYLKWSNSKWCKSIEDNNWHPDSIALAICQSPPMEEVLLKWWGQWRLVKSPISAKELILQGWEKGPMLGKELARLRYLELDSYHE